MPSRFRSALIATSMLLLFTASMPAAGQDRDVYDDITDEMQDIRGLSLSDPLDITFMTRDEYIETLEAEPDEDPEAEDVDDRQVLVAFGFIEPDEDPDEILGGLLGEQVAGYYDPETKEMVVILSNDGDEPSVLDMVTFAHEAVHAIQDQNFDLQSYNELRLDGSDDSYLAVTAMIEGDATLAQIDYLLANPDIAVEYLDALDGAAGGEALDGAPDLFVAILSFPYNHGFEFAQALHDEGGWDLVNEAYDDPPTTSEQIMHPEKYLDGEAAIEVAAPDVQDALGHDWQAIDVNTYGEYIISVMLADSDLGERQVERAHTGWGGDEYAAYSDGADTAIAWATAWDSDDDADEFFKALGIRESQRLDADADGEGDEVTIEGDDWAVRIILDGNMVTSYLGPDLETVDAMVEAG